VTDTNEIEMFLAKAF